jgi:hypothetical protein
MTNDDESDDTTTTTKTNADLFAKTEGFLTAIQDQVILTRHYKKYILKQPNINKMCRRCGKKREMIQHITAACEQLAPTEYIKRHDEVAKVIHQKLAEAAELTEDKCPYYRYKPANVVEKDSFKLYWNRSIITGKTIPSNLSDITLMNKKTKNTLLIDIAIPNTHILAKTITEKQEIPRTGEQNTCYVEAGYSESAPDSNFSYGNNSKVTVTKS